jgi:hypothetical protein
MPVPEKILQYDALLEKLEMHVVTARGKANVYRCPLSYVDRILDQIPGDGVTFNTGQLATSVFGRSRKGNPLGATPTSVVVALLEQIGAVRRISHRELTLSGKFTREGVLEAISMLLYREFDKELG